ncbi:MAG: hypothetical protein LC667_02980 [Thioalkalivibrio sp.]|nr:hypothetical protein [Thioalkalivibrio sp.]
MRPARLIPAFCLLLVAACRPEATGPGGPSWFRASVEGEVMRQFEGTGRFASEPDRTDAGAPDYFQLSAKGLDSETEEVFHLRWPSGARPGVGTHALVRHADPYGSSAGVTGIYRWSRGDNVTAPFGGELYVAVSGRVEITTSTTDAVEGTIRFSGVQVTRMGVGANERDDPRQQPDASAPRIEVSGSFRATPWSDNLVVTTGR